MLVRDNLTFIGIACALIRPVLAMLVLAVVFGKLARLPSGDFPYPILVFCGLLPWQFFSSSLSESSNSLIANSNLISKVYFPRLVVPASAVITSLVDFLIAGGFLAVLMMWYRFAPDWRTVTLPLFITITFVAAIGPSMWLAALKLEDPGVRLV